jgi:hypothetical protein
VIIPIDQVARCDAQGIWLALDYVAFHRLPDYRTDHAIAHDVDQALRDDEVVRRLDYRSIDVAVDAGATRRRRQSLHLPRRILGDLHQTDKGLEVTQAQDSAARRQDDEGVGVGQIGPDGWEGAEMGRDGVTKEDAGFAPGDALFNQRELLVSKRVKGMGNGKNLIPIQAIGCSWALTRPDQLKATSIGSS